MNGSWNGADGQKHHIADAIERCVCTTPLGTPLVPLVKKTLATAVGAGCAGATGAAAPRRISAESVASTTGDATSSKQTHRTAACCFSSATRSSRSPAAKMCVTRVWATICAGGESAAGATDLLRRERRVQRDDRQALAVARELRQQPLPAVPREDRDEAPRRQRERAGDPGRDVRGQLEAPRRREFDVPPVRLVLLVLFAVRDAVLGVRRQHQPRRATSCSGAQRAGRACGR